LAQALQPFSVWPKQLLGQNKQLLAATCLDMHFCRIGA